MSSPATRAAGPQVGASVRLKPGLRGKPYSASTAQIVAVLNDRLKIRVGALEYVVERSEVQT
jgi:hypothetical protein